MKSFFALAVATTALATVNAVDCDLTKLAPLLTDTDVKTCGSETGLSPPTPPSSTVLPKLCGNTACQAALAKLKALNVGDCTALGYRLETDFINPIEKYCASSTPAPATTAPAPATSPSPTTAAPKTPTPSSVAPSPTSGSPTTSTPSTSKPSTTSGSGSDTTIEDNKNPISVAGSGSSNGTAPNVTTPSPTPKSGASSAALAASAVVLAVAAAFM